MPSDLASPKWVEWKKHWKYSSSRLSLTTVAFILAVVAILIFVTHKRAGNLPLTVWAGEHEITTLGNAGIWGKVNRSNTVKPFYAFRAFSGVCCSFKDLDCCSSRAEEYFRQVVFSYLIRPKNSIFRVKVTMLKALWTKECPRLSQVKSSASNWIIYDCGMSNNLVFWCKLQKLLKRTYLYRYFQPIHWSDGARKFASLTPANLRCMFVQNQQLTDLNRPNILYKSYGHSKYWDRRKSSTRSTNPFQAEVYCDSTETTSLCPQPV